MAGNQKSKRSKPTALLLIIAESQSQNEYAY